MSRGAGDSAVKADLQAARPPEKASEEMPSSRSGAPSWLLDGLVVIVPLCIVVLHGLVFGRWIVDDAGISFAFARNLAEGHGLVTQPGVTPVEGYSNFLWVLLMAALFAVRAFDIVLTPKIVAVALTAGSFHVMSRVLRRLGPGSRWVCVVALAVTALQTSFALWTISGLENPLYVFLVSVLLSLCLPLLEGRAATRTRVIAAAVTAFGLAITRPEGLLFAFVPPMFLGAQKARERRARQAPPASDPMRLYLGILAVLWSAMLAFRGWYFGDAFPNTFYVKSSRVAGVFARLIAEAPHGAGLLVVAALLLGGLTTGSLITARLAAGLEGRIPRGAPPALVALWAFSAVSFAIYKLMPTDWMPEYRFATPLILLLPAALLSTAWELSARLWPDAASLRRLGFGVLATALLLGSMAHSSARSRELGAEPVISLQRVLSRSDRFGAAAALLQDRHASVLLPDVGGMLFTGPLRIYDLAGLCDRRVARMMIARDKPSFYEYVFAEMRPDFIDEYGPWTKLATLKADPRFERDYVIVCRRPGDEDAGLFVRRDALAARGGLLPELRAILTLDSDAPQLR